MTGQKVDRAWQNQDTHLILPLGAGRTLVAVFDGHGTWGHALAACARDAFARRAPECVPAAPAPLSEICAGAALTGLFALAQATVARVVDGRGQQVALTSGTTASAVIVDGVAGVFHRAHVGDSAVATTCGGQVLSRSEDHVVDEAAEARIRLLGGEVREFTISSITARRVCLPGQEYPGLAMSRALGDLLAQRLGVSAVPEVCTGIPLGPGATLIVASDGVWEKLPAEAAARCVEEGRDVQEAARRLVEASRAAWPASGNIDDITAVVVRAVESPATVFV